MEDADKVWGYQPCRSINLQCFDWCGWAGAGLAGPRLGPDKQLVSDVVRLPQGTASSGLVSLCRGRGGGVGAGWSVWGDRIWQGLRHG